jgi:glycosyltransferase involved in cell wall biosynthesis
VPRILVIPPGHDAPAIPAPVPGRRLILGCFAEGLDTEGTEVLLEAAAVLRAWPATARAIRIELHGEASGLARAGVEAVGAPLLRCTGLPGRDVEAALRGCHSVIIPGGSQADAPAIAVRALAHGRPVLCADAGGTARLVRDGRDGFHFPAQSGAALADLLDDLAAAPDRLAALRPDRDALQSLSSMRETTIGLYRSLLAGTA